MFSYSQKMALIATESLYWRQRLFVFVWFLFLIFLFLPSECFLSLYLPSQSLPRLVASFQTQPQPPVSTTLFTPCLWIARAKKAYTLAQQAVVSCHAFPGCNPAPANPGLFATTTCAPAPTPAPGTGSLQQYLGSCPSGRLMQEAIFEPGACVPVATGSQKFDCSSKTYQLCESTDCSGTCQSVPVTGVCVGPQILKCN
jgi:hypothetical protein